MERNGIEINVSWARREAGRTVGRDMRRIKLVSHTTIEANVSNLTNVTTLTKWYSENVGGM